MQLLRLISVLDQLRLQVALDHVGKGPDVFALSLHRVNANVPGSVLCISIVRGRTNGA